MLRFREVMSGYWHRVAQTISDFSPLHTLPAFQALEMEVQLYLKTQGSYFTR